MAQIDGAGRGVTPRRRSRAHEIRDSRNDRQFGALLNAATPGGFKIAFKTAPLSEVEAAWPKDDSACRTVFTLRNSRGRQAGE